MRRREEDIIYEAISEYLKSMYPMLPFRFDFGADATMFYSQAAFQKKIQKGRAWPDLVIYAPKMFPVMGAEIVQWHGMFLEVKKNGFNLYKRDGKTPVSDHVREQMTMIEHLKVAGYWAEFGIGTDDCIVKIDKYLINTAYKKRGSWKSDTVR